MSTTLWLTVTEANTYFDTRLGAAKWVAEGDDGDKLAALTTAQWQIENSGAYTFESGITPTDAMQEAVCEQALFLLNDQEGMEKRASLQAQGVRDMHVGDFGEGYRMAGGIVISPKAHVALATYQLGGGNTFRFER